MDTASEPCTCVVEGDCLLGSERRGMRLTPVSPKRTVVSTRVEENGQLIHMVNDPVAKKEIAKEVEREITEMIDRAEARKGETGYLAFCSSLPEGLNLGNMDSRNPLIPKAKMELNPKRHLRIIEIASPLAIAKPNHGTYVVGIC